MATTRSSAPKIEKRRAVPAFLALAGVLALGACQSGSQFNILDGARTPQDTTAPVASQGTETAPARPAQETRRRSLEEILAEGRSAQERLQADIDAQARRAALPPGVVRIGLLLPLSGPNAQVGEDLLNAAQLALFDFGSESFELSIQDTGGSPQGAAQAMQAALGQGVQLVIGPLLSASVKAAAPIATRAGINVLALSNDRTAAAPGVYLLGFRPGEEVERVVSYTLSRGLNQFAVLGPDNAYGQTVAQALQATVQRLGGSVSRVSLYDPATEDFSQVVRDLADFDSRKARLRAQIRELQGRPDEISRRTLERLERQQTLGDAPFQALLIAQGGKKLQSLAALLPFYDIDPSRVRILGTGLWDNVPRLGAEPALVGAWYAAPPPTARQGFVSRFADTYGRQPARLATLAYDAVALAAVLSQGGGQGRFERETLTQASGFAGRDGIFRLLPDGLNQHGLAVLEVGPRGVEVVSPAPQTFEAVIN